MAMGADKRVVVRHTSGRLTGLYQFFGLITATPTDAYPARIDNVDLDGLAGNVILAGPKARYVLYTQELPIETA